MIRRLLFALLLAVPACGSSDDTTPAPPTPDGTSCGSSVGAADGGALVSALGAAGDGTCVVLNGAHYSTSQEIVVKHGVTLVGAKGARPTLDHVRLEGGTLANVDIDVGGIEANGVDVLGGALRDVKVTGSKAGAVVIPASDGATLTDVVIEKSAIGLYVAYAPVTMTGGHISEIGGEALTAGIGMVIANGANVTLDGVAITNNRGTGVLVDGKSTRLTTKNVKVLDNVERGIWAQGVEGTLDTPAVRLEDTEVARNRIVGVGALESHGIIVVGGRIAETIATPIVTNLATTEPVGDGIGMFDRTGDVKIDGTLVEQNERAAGIVDGSDRGIIVVGGRVEASSSGLKFVIQNTTADVQIADDMKSVSEKPLAIAASKLTVPTFNAR